MTSPNDNDKSAALALGGRVAHPAVVVALMVVMAATLLMLPAFIRGFPAGNDADLHFRWARQFREAMAEPGVFYPRWLGAANNGQGSPAMLYYPPLALFVTAAFGLVTGNTLTTLSLACWLGLLISGLTMYGFARKLLDWRAALFAALLYMAAPYHLFDLYQGAALAEFWSFAWIPLVLNGVYRAAAERGWRAVATLASGYALLLLTHLPLSFALSLVLPVFAVLLTRDLKSLAKIAAGLLLGAGLAAGYLAPVVSERGYVSIGSLLMFDYQRFFLLRHLRMALNATMFAPDPSLYPSGEPAKLAPFLYLLKAEQAVAAFLLVMALSAVVLLVRRRALLSSLLDSTLPRRLVVALLAVTALSLLMTTRRSAFVWQAVPQLSYLQFPFRWLVVVTAGGCVLVALALRSLLPLNRWRIVPALLLGAAVVLALVTSGLMVARTPTEPTFFDASRPRREVPEYRPVWWDKQLHEEETLPAVTVTGGQAEVSVSDGEGVHQQYAVNVANTATLRFRTLYFPGWGARVDGNAVGVAPDETGHIQLDLAPGEHQLSLRFEDTPPRRAGKVLSFVSLMALGALLLARRVSRRKLKREL
ncbi:MAG TPA: 6-pyruvoyl-tetrahydropterin synthase-related protein [Blastocatellia bacterium]|nr:6-pyruvoyl-tetrahydropterin synthase-related protein [Blastocatellia bacterium]